MQIFVVSRLSAPNFLCDMFLGGTIRMIHNKSLPNPKQTSSTKSYCPSKFAKASAPGVAGYRYEGIGYEGIGYEGIGYEGIGYEGIGYEGIGMRV